MSGDYICMKPGFKRHKHLQAKNQISILGRDLLGLLETTIVVLKIAINVTKTPTQKFVKVDVRLPFRAMELQPEQVQMKCQTR